VTRPAIEYINPCSTHIKSFRRRAFQGNQLHWFWQPKTWKQNTTYALKGLNTKRETAKNCKLA